jgi:O-antigen ligase
MIDTAILWITLAMLFVIPLIFNFGDFVSIFSELKVVTLHLGAGSIAILWLWQASISKINSSSPNAKPISIDLLKWAGKDPTRWLVIGVTAWLVAQGVSALFSPLPVVSLLGADDLRSGYNFYDNISLYVIFVSVALRFRTQSRLRMLIFTLIASGSIAAFYGIAQHFGWDPIGHSEGRTRVWSSFGNPLNFGAYLVMTIPATLAMTLPKWNRRYIWLGVLSVALGLQLAALWYTGGRGPYVSFAVALIIFVAIGAMITHIRSLTSAGIALLAGAAVAIAIVALPTAQDDIGVSRVLSIGDQVIGAADGTTGAGLDPRFDIWSTTLNIATGWDSPADDSGISSVLRPVFGLGPDMYVYSYPLAAPPSSSNFLVDHPHNYELQVLMEQGFIGLLLLLTVILVILLLAYKLVVQARSHTNEFTFTTVLILAIVPAVLGKLMEMQTGVSRVSELAMTFALFGAISAIWAVSSQQQSTTEPPATTTTPEKKSLIAFTLTPNMATGSVIFSALIATVVVFITFVSWDVRRTSASLEWAAALTAPSDIERATGWFESQEKAPERPMFTNSLFIELFNAAIDQHSSGNDDNGLQLMHTARNLLLDFEQRDPFKRDNQINLFKTEITLSQWGQSEFEQTAIDRSRTIFKLYPAYPAMLNIIVADMTLIGRDDLAAEYAEAIPAGE